MRLNGYKPLKSILKNPGMTSEDVSRYIYALSRPGAATAALNYYRAMLSSLTRKPPRDAWRKSTVSMPTLVLWGMDDVALGPKLLNGLESVVADVKVVRIDDCSHWVMSEQPDVVNREILAFLQ